MSNAAVLYDNLADAAVVTASSWIASAPPALLKNAHVARRWCGRNGTNEYLLVDFGGLVTFDTIAAFGLQAVIGDSQINMPATAISQIRASTVDSSGIAGDAYNSGVAAGRISNKFACLVQALATPVIARYVRIDLTEVSALALLAGRLVIGKRNRFGINFEYGWNAGYEDLSRSVVSAGGQTFIEVDDTIRTLTLNFGFMSEADRYGFVEDMNRLNGTKKDVLFLIDPDSDDLARDSIWGLKERSAVTQPMFEVFAMPVTIRERR